MNITDLFSLSIDLDTGHVRITTKEGNYWPLSPGNPPANFIITHVRDKLTSILEKYPIDNILPDLPDKEA